MWRGKCWISYNCSLKGELFSEWESLNLFLFGSCLWPIAWTRQRENPVGFFPSAHCLSAACEHCVWVLTPSSIPAGEQGIVPLGSFFHTYIPHCVMCVLFFAYFLRKSTVQFMWLNQIRIWAFWFELFQKMKGNWRKINKTHSGSIPAMKFHTRHANSIKHLWLAGFLTDHHSPIPMFLSTVTNFCTFLVFFKLIPALEVS